MKFKNIEIHGCYQLKENDKGAYETVRVPDYVYDKLSDLGKSQATGCTGIEFRFVLKDEQATLKFRYNADERGKITVYHGDFVADWPETTKLVNGECEITINQCKYIENLRSIAKEYNHRFSPDVVRLVFEGVKPHIVDVCGNIELPCADMCPETKYLAYGSSITQGSISLHPYFNYVERVAAGINADVTNFGFAGSALLEKEMADYIADECEFDIATLEMGINVINIDPSDYENRVRYFLNRIATAHPKSLIFAIDVYYCKSDIIKDGRAECFRAILKKVTDEFKLDNVVYVNGKTVLKDAAKLTTGLVHPNPDGALELAQNLTEIMKKHIKKDLF